MHKSCLGAIIIDCQTDDLEREVRFWSQALGYKTVAPQPGDDPNYIALKVPEGKPEIEVQRVAHPSRVHLDLKTDNVAAEVARLEKLGARVVEVLERWTVMEAPSGQRFCVVVAPSVERYGSTNVWEE